MKPPSTSLFGDEHVRRYRETDGAEGFDWLGMQILLLTTIGRKSGVPRTKPLVFREWDGAYLVVASNGGSDVASNWLFNLEADPAVEVQIKGEIFAATAHVATEDEKPPMWAHMVEVFPTYAEFQEHTERAIQVVVLERAPHVS